MTQGRPLQKQEIPLLWTIDRRERIERIGYHTPAGIEFREERYDMGGWPPGEAEKGESMLRECFDRGGWFRGEFNGERLVAAAVLDSRFLPGEGRRLQLSFLHVGHGARGRGLGRKLFELAAAEARARGATHLYISATPSENTIGFYRGMGCCVTARVDPELFALEPLDIHFECPLLAQ
ncbi:MAG: GNAT family N-acetyltransferase [Planctomycetes bacterium]|nr:GNAT family N-acetyltransferase [Planctomycetota bacterium]